MCLFPAILYLLSVPLICISLLLVFFLFFVRLFFLLLNFGILGVLTYYKEWMTLSGAPARSVIPRQPLNSPSLNDWKVFSDWYTIGNRLINEVTTFPSLCCLLIDYAREHQFQVSLKCQPSLRPFPTPSLLRDGRGAIWAQLEPKQPIKDIFQSTLGSLHVQISP